MTDAAAFKRVNHWFNQLVESPIDQQQSTIKQLLKNGELNQEQVNLLFKMLAADKVQDMPDSVADLAHDWLQEDTETQLSEQPIIGSYRLLELIGSGGMGHVYLAERNDGSYQQQVAIKISQFHLNKNLVKRFENERQILAQLTHPHIAQLLDGGTAANDQPFIVMEHINGLSIDQYAIKNNLGLKQRLDLMLQTCEAVSFAHQNLVLHRDLKPANILINEAGQVKLLDFGIAKLLSDDVDKQTQTMTQIMTRNYASPEQIKGQLVTTQSDLFSLAIICYELVSGFHPYAKQTDFDRDQNVVSGKVKSITQRADKKQALYPELTTIGNDKLRGDLENILIKALSPATTERYSSVESFADDIRNFMLNRPVKARKSSWLYSLRKLIQRQKVLVTSVAFLSLCLALVTAYSIQKAKDAEIQRNLAVKESQQAKLIANFLTGVFTSAKPRSDKKELTARDLLNQGFVDIKNELHDDPEHRFEMISVMLDSLESLSYFDTIFAYVDELYPECVAALSAQNDYCQMLLITAGEAAIGTQQDQLALSYLQRAEKIGRLAPINQAILIEILRIQFNAYINLKQFDQAVSTTQEALDYYQNINYSPIDIINIKSDLAVLATHQENFAEAKKYYDSMLEIVEQDADIDVDLKGLFYANYSFFFAKQKLFDQAIEQRKKSVEVMQRAYDRPSFSLAWEQESLAKLYFFAGQFESGIRTAKASLRTFESLDSEADKHVYELKLFIAQMQVLSGHVESAQEIMSALTANKWDKRCLFVLVQALIDVYSQQHAKVDPSLMNYESCVATASYPTKFALEFSLLLKAEINFARSNHKEAEKYLNQLLAYWQFDPHESLPLQHKAMALKNKLTHF